MGDRGRSHSKSDRRLAYDCDSSTDVPRLPKAFLSHSSIDKPYLSAVASLLGRAKTHIDSKSFARGEDFRREIRRTLDDSEVFVFFVSPESLRSTWCEFELDEADSVLFAEPCGRAWQSLSGARRTSPRCPNGLDGSRRSATRTLRSRHTRSSPSSIKWLLRIDIRSSGVTKSCSGTCGSLHRRIRFPDCWSRPVSRASVDGLTTPLVSEGLGLDLAPMIVLPAAGTLEDLFMGSTLSIALLSRSRWPPAVPTSEVGKGCDVRPPRHSATLRSSLPRSRPKPASTPSERWRVQRIDLEVKAAEHERALFSGVAQDLDEDQRSPPGGARCAVSSSPSSTAGCLRVTVARGG
jgi:hypothetical protein